MRAVLLGLLLATMAGLSSPAHAQELFPLQAVTVTVGQNCSSDGTAGGRGMPSNYPYTSDGAAVVSWSDCYQIIDGWGADNNFNWGAQTPGSGVTLGGMQGVYSLTNGNGGPGMGLTHMRTACTDPGFTTYATTQVQCGPPIGQFICDQAKYLTQLGGVPYWVDGLLYSKNFPNFNSIFAADIPTIASNTVTWLQQLKSQCGAAFFTYSIFNEDSGTFQNTDQCTGRHDFIAALSSAFSAAGITTKFALPEEVSFGTGFSNAACTMNDPTTAAAVNVIDWHGYGAVNAPYPYQSAGKHGWMTEYAGSFATGAHTDQWAQAQAVVADFLNNLEWGVNLVEYQNGYCPVSQNTDTYSCWAFDQGGYDTFSVTAYAYGQLSRYVRPGWHLYGSTTSPYADGSVSMLFFRAPATKDFAVVALNTATSNRNLSVSFRGFVGSSVTPIETTAVGAQWAQQASLPASGGFSFALPPQSVTTFIGTGS